MTYPLLHTAIPTNQDYESKTKVPSHNDKRFRLETAAHGDLRCSDQRIQRPPNAFHSKKNQKANKLKVTFHLTRRMASWQKRLCQTGGGSRRSGQLWWWLFSALASATGYCDILTQEPKDQEEPNRNELKKTRSLQRQQRRQSWPVEWNQAAAAVLQKYCPSSHIVCKPYAARS